MAMIETQGLTKTFKTREGTVEAVRGVDLIVDEGEICGFLGPNGAGKTTTMRMLATLLPPTSGRAKICGYDLLREAGQVRWQIGYVGQKGGAEPTETGHGAQREHGATGSKYALAFVPPERWVCVC
jgi:ABC-2 type transport system ATP-binding protein